MCRLFAVFFTCMDGLHKEMQTTLLTKLNWAHYFQIPDIQCDAFKCGRSMQQLSFLCKWKCKETGSGGWGEGTSKDWFIGGGVLLKQQQRPCHCRFTSRLHPSFSHRGLMVELGSATIIHFHPSPYFSSFLCFLFLSAISISDLLFQ